MDRVVENGVFLHSMDTSSLSMAECLHALVNAVPNIKITSIVPDDLHFGFRFCFSSPDEGSVLEKKELIVSGKNVRMGPLTTLLTIHGVRTNGGERYEAELRETVGNKFGRLLRVDLANCRNTASNPQPFLLTKLRALVDVPELEELEIFNHEGYNEMFIVLPTDNEMLRVTFHCRRCDNDGHVQQKCPLTPNAEPHMTSGILDSSNRRHSLSYNSVNRGTNSSEDFRTIPSDLQGIFPFLSDTTADSPPRNLYSPLKPATQSVFFAAPSTTEVKVTNTTTTTPKTPFKFTTSTTSCEYADSELTGRTSFESASTEPIRTTSFKFENTAPTPPTSFEFANMPPTPSTSFYLANTAPTPATSGTVTRNLSPRLREIVNIACREVNVIDSDQLGNFFFYVKNKPNPLEIARIYTSNIGKLIELLQTIISFHYNSPPPKVSAEDEKFMKWLKSLKKRFEDNIVRQ